MRPRFEIVSGIDHVPGRPSYVDGDYAFSYVLDSEELAKETEGAEGTASFAVDTLEIVVSCEKRLMLWIDGYWPYHSWRRHPLGRPRSIRGGVRVTTPHELKRGITHRIPADAWTTRFDPRTGWVFISRRGANETENAVEFALDTLATIDDGNLNAIWIRPANWADLVPKVP